MVFLPDFLKLCKSGFIGLGAPILGIPVWFAKADDFDDLGNGVWSLFGHKIIITLGSNFIGSYLTEGNQLVEEVLGLVGNVV